jgi:threonine dehydrogenase-like Zn-dependent dehydrogenase
MLGLWLEAGLARLRRDLPVPEPAADEARVRVTCAGICGTDLELLRGYAGFEGVPGHEMVGVVEAGPREWRGRRIVADINFGCGACDECRDEGGRHCERRRVLGIRGAHGALAERTIVPVANLVAVPDELDDPVAVFAEPVAAACRVADQLADAGVGSGAPVAVLGAGRLGQLVGRVLAARAYDATVWGRSQSSLALARAGGLRARPAEEIESASITTVVDCTGTARGFATALRALRPGGTLALKSTFAAREALDLSPIVVKELRLLGSRCGELRDGIEALRQDLVDPRDLVVARYPLERVEEALADAARPGGRKILVFP